MIKITTPTHNEYTVDQFVFNDGSVQVQINGLRADVEKVWIDAILQSPADQMALVMVVQAIRDISPDIRMILNMPFCPYGRQDSTFVPGQANAMKAWARLINSLGFEIVYVTDPHSIGVNLIDNVIVTDVVEYLECCMEDLRTDKMVLVSPDAGANKKAHKIAEHFEFDELIRADKARNLKTGEIIETLVYGDVEGKDCLIVDDICDGGMTFIKLAEKLKALGADKVVLFVTHGLFTKGLEVFDGLIDEIYTTETWPQEGRIDEYYKGKFVQIEGI